MQRRRWLADRGRPGRACTDVARPARDRVSRLAACTAPPPSSGFQYLECLKILEAFDLAGARAQLDRVPAPAAGDDQARQRRPDALRAADAGDHRGAALRPSTPPSAGADRSPARRAERGRALPRPTRTARCSRDPSATPRTTRPTSRWPTARATSSRSPRATGRRSAAASWPATPASC